MGSESTQTRGLILRRSFGHWPLYGVLTFLTVEITNFRMRAAKAAIPPCSAPKMHICSGTGDGGSPDMAGQTDYQFPRQFLEGRLDL